MILSFGTLMSLGVVGEGNVSRGLEESLGLSNEGPSLPAEITQKLVRVKGKQVYLERY